MPNKSERKRILEALEVEIFTQQMVASDSDDEKEETELLMMADDDDYSATTDSEDEEDLHLLKSNVYCEDDDTFEQVYLEVASTRYLERGLGVARPSDRLKWLLSELDDFRFKQEVRMPRERFQQLVQLICRHQIFKASKKPQRPVEHQLLVALRRLGCFGNGASIGMTARYFAISGKSMSIFFSFFPFMNVFTYHDVDFNRGFG